MIVHVVSVSGGKDSLATLLIAIARFGRYRIRAIFCDTGNEHDATYNYLEYLEFVLDITIHRLRASFDDEIAAKRLFIARDQRTRREYDKVPKLDKQGNIVYRRNSAGEVALRLVWTKDGPDVVADPVIVKQRGRLVRWSNKAKRGALEVMHPTGNPFLDLCLWKGRFPSRKAQFCTERLKRDPAVEFQLALVDQGHTVVSWQGVRRDESENRRLAKKFERIGPRMFIYRPIADWTAQQTVDFATERGIQSNPLYSQGMNRVGCMPCINVAKEELRQISLRFPLHVDRIEQWEAMVSRASKRGFSTMMADAHAAKDRRVIFAELNIRSRVEWSKTTRGGRQYDLLAPADEEPTACSSSYGLCG